MNVALWVAAVLLALVFLASGIMKTFRYEQDGHKLESIKGLPRRLIAVIGVSEILGALGLIVPAATGILPWLTPVAAACLVLVMILATAFHALRRETSGIGLTLVLMLLAAFVAYGRFVMISVA